MDKWRFAHFEGERDCLFSRFIFNSVARQGSSFSAFLLSSRRIPEIRGAPLVAFLLFLRRDARFRNFINEIANVTLTRSYGSTHVNKSDTLWKISLSRRKLVRARIERIFRAARKSRNYFVSVCFRCIVFDSFSFEDKKSNFTVLLNSRFIFVYLTLYVTRCIKMKYWIIINL